MQRMTVCIVAMFVLLADSSSYAQCNRGARGGRATAVGRFTPLATSVGLGSTLGTYNPLGQSPGGAMSAIQYRSLLARQQYLLAQQQRIMKAAYQGQNSGVQNSGVQNSGGSSPAAATGNLSLGDAAEEKATPTNTRRDRLRQQNANKSFTTAKTAERNQRWAAAKRHYEKVVRILGESDPLGRQATEALNQLAHGPQQVQPVELDLASRTR